MEILKHFKNIQKVLSPYFKNKFLEMQYNLHKVHQVKMQIDEFSQSEHTCVTGIPNNKENLKELQALKRHSYSFSISNYYVDF